MDSVELQDHWSSGFCKMILAQLIVKYTLRILELRQCSNANNALNKIRQWLLNVAF